MTNYQLPILNYPLPMITWIIGHILAIFIGVSLGLLGGGGSVLAVPVLVYVMKVPVKPAIAMTLAVVGTASIIGVIPHWKRGNVRLKTAFIFGSATMLGAFLGARLASLPFITPAFQMLLFAISMLVAAGFMIKRSSQPATPPKEEIDLNLYPKPVCKYCWLWLLTEGLGVGVLTGLVGVGGGFAIVPALVLLGKIPMRQAIGTSLLILTGNSISGFLGYLGHQTLDWGLMGSFVIAACLGTLIGSHYSHFVNPQKLQRNFAYFLIAVATLVMFQNRDSLNFSKPHVSKQPSQKTSIYPRKSNFLS